MEISNLPIFLILLKEQERKLERAKEGKGVAIT